MALIKCNECGGQMSDQALKCPHCGCPVSVQPAGKSRRWLLWVAIAVIGLVGCGTGAYFLLKEEPVLKVTPELTKALQKYDIVKPFSEGMAAVWRENAGWGYINLKGEEVIPCQLGGEFTPGYFSEGLACVEHDRPGEGLLNHRVGFINKKGEWVLEGDFFTESPIMGSVWGDMEHCLPMFRNGVCPVWDTAVSQAHDDSTESGFSKEYEDNKEFFIDKKGNQVEGTEYAPLNFETKSTPEEDGLVKVKKGYEVIGEYTDTRDTTYCDNEARLVKWDIYYLYLPYEKYHKTVYYILDRDGNSTLTKEQADRMEENAQFIKAQITQAYEEEEARKEAERKAREEAMRREWFYGTWEYSGYSHLRHNFGKHFTVKLFISKNNLTQYFDNRLDYNGPYTLEGNKIVFDHTGYRTAINLDFNSQRLEYGRGEYFHKVSSSTSSSTSGSSYSSSGTSSSSSSSYSSSTTFRTEADVWAYLSGRKFTSGSTSIRIYPQYLEVSGRPTTGAVRVSNIRGSRATLSASSPMMGGQTIYLNLNAANGTIENDGTYFYSR